MNESQSVLFSAITYGAMVAALLIIAGLAIFYPEVLQF